MSKIQSERRSCQLTWCLSLHEEEEFIEKNLFHSKSFGTYDDGSLGVIQIGVTERGENLKETEVFIETLELVNAQDLRDLARDCLLAATWMDQYLTQPSGHL